MNTFGPAIATFRGNRIVIAVFSILAVVSAYLAWMSRYGGEENSLGDYRLYAAIAIVLAGFALWTSRRHVTLHAEGISYRNLLGEKYMRWDDVEKFYYSATKRSVNLIPIGTYYSYKLLDAKGNKIALGNGIEHPKDLGVKLNELTYPPLLKKAAHQFDNGLNVDFGAIKVSRAAGITAKKWFRWKQVPLNQLYSYSIQGGMFYIWSTGEKLVCAPAMADVPNAFVLHGLLDAIFTPKAQSAHAN